ncbi:MAG: CobW family GTP-binding protein [Arenicella sp.]
MIKTDIITGPIPTNIITGFLGTGKTSAIAHLLKQKPAGERWAVLVNEFGEIGVDGSLFQGQHTEDQGVFVHEVPGGCMCCTAGLSMQIALSQLLARSRPDRLLIEPSGLGHPAEVLHILCSEHYGSMLYLQKILTLVDARKLTDKRYTEHETFNQQIALADIIIGNKQDLYLDSDKTSLQAYTEKQNSLDAKLIFTEQGAIDISWLEGPTAAISQPNNNLLQNGQQAQAESLDEKHIPECGFIKAENHGEGFHSVGWRFSTERQFNRHKLFTFLSGISAERVKAVFLTDTGIWSYNLTADALTEIELDYCSESRIEMIAKNINDDWEEALMDCMVS